MSENTKGHSQAFGAQSMVGRLRRVLVRRPSWSPTQVTAEKDWKSWGYSLPPDLCRAQREHDAFTNLLRENDAELVYADQPHPALYDSIFTYDIAIVLDSGAVILNSGKPARQPESSIIEAGLISAGVPVIARMNAPATADGGDMLWLDHDTLLVGRSYRTNELGITFLQNVLAEYGIKVLTAPVVHWHGPSEVMHLMSVISPVDHDLAVVYSKLLAVETMELLKQRDIAIVEVSDEEFVTQGANVLAVAPRRCIMVEGNPGVRRALERQGVDVAEYPGDEVTLKMGGGPTCMTRPILRE